LEFTILTAARTEETTEATWPEFDLKAKVWTVPAERMKADREHRVPLSDAVVRLLRAMHNVRESDDGFVFPGAAPGCGLSNMAMLELLRGMRPGLTVHGFRSTFRDWAAERTSFDGQVVEMALAHVVKNKTEAAYRRGDLFEKRRPLMREWAQFCARKPNSTT
jgi:integrase